MGSKAERAAATEAAQRRVWRLAFLLTADPDAAAALADRVIATQPDPAGMDPARLDRLIVLKSREWARANPRPPTPVAARTGNAPPGVLAAVAGLPRQLLEAWVFRRVDGLDELRTSRSMDCSRIAGARHLEAADALLRERLGPAAAEAAAFMDHAASAVDPRPLIAACRRRRLRRKRVWQVAMLVALLAAAILALVALPRLLPVSGGP